MKLKFPSPEWVAKYREELNAGPWKESGKGWTYGPISFVVKKDEKLGINEDIYLWLDIDKGFCKEAKIVSKEEGEKAPFVIYGDYARWKQIINGELEPIKALAQGKLQLKGNLATIVKFVKAAEDMVKTAQKVPTEFID
ncbi:MAG: SCP2 sterol-binding domain-containing protein [Candidatus Calescibacterium sp.]|jgi:putative sterol carrier protein